MVDVRGCPMFGRTPFMDKNSSVYQPPSIAFGHVTNAADPIQNLALGTVSKGTAIDNYSFGQILGGDSGYTFNDDGISEFGQDQVGTANFYTSASGGRGLNVQTYRGRNSTVVLNSTAEGLGQAINDPSGWKNTMAGRAPANGSALWSNHSYLPVASFVPSQWPDFQPCTLSGEVDDYEVDSIIGKTKVSEYMKYLANVRSLPIGVPGRSPDYQGSYVSNVAQLTASNAPYVTSENTRYMEYRVSMPFLSGIYGILADKMFPDLLIGANNIRIEFKLAQNQKALWLTMDPCRRVPGTVRDFAPFTGEAHSSIRGGRIAQDRPWAQTADGDPTSANNRAATALGCFYSRVLPYDSTATGGYSGITRYNVPSNDATQNPGDVQAEPWFKIVRDSNMYNTASALGEDLVATQAHSLVRIPAINIPALTVTNNATPATTIAAGTSDAITDSNGKLWGGHYCVFSNLPKPQYIPHADPWNRKSFFTGAGHDVAVHANHCNENASCYGTYLPASVPQTRRCQPASRLRIADPTFASAGTTVFAIRDLQYIGEQVQLDDISASAIIQLAATSEIVVWTRGYRSFEANCTVGEQQNIILPIQIGQATALYLVFRPGSQILNFDYYSNSFSCPFTGLSFDGSRTGSEGDIYYGRNGVQADVGGRYEIKSSLDTQNNGLFSYQLFSGTRQYPLQPIQTVSDLLVEREKSTHSLHNWSWCGTENMSLISWGKNNSFNSGNTTGMSFDPFLDLGYFTTFVPTMALDDQTITQNPYMSIAEVDENGTNRPRVRGIRQTPAVSDSQSVFVGVLNTYVPPIGTFFLGWDFESWTNHEDLMRTGKFLGQEQLSVRMTGCYLMSATNPAASYAGPVAQPVQCTAIVPHIVKLSFVPGGHMLSYY